MRRWSRARTLRRPPRASRGTPDHVRWIPTSRSAADGPRLQCPQGRRLQGSAVTLAMKLLTDSAEACGLTIDTLRYRERAGLTLWPTPRTASGQRRNHERELSWLISLVMLREMPRLRPRETLQRQALQPETDRTELVATVGCYVGWPPRGYPLPVHPEVVDLGDPGEAGADLVFHDLRQRAGR
jgi:hypothetical protein